LVVLPPAYAKIGPSGNKKRKGGARVRGGQNKREGMRKIKG